MLTSQAVEICEKTGKKTITEVEIMLALEVSSVVMGLWLAAPQPLERHSNWSCIVTLKTLKRLLKSLRHSLQYVLTAGF